GAAGRVVGALAIGRWRARGAVVGTEKGREPHAGAGRGGDRTVTSVADDEHRDRREAADGGLDRGCGAGPHRVASIVASGTGRATESVLPASSRGAHPYRHQAAGTVPSARPRSERTRRRSDTRAGASWTAGPPCGGT